MQFHETRMGNNFFTGQLPQLIKALNRVADAMEKANETKPEVKTEETDEYKKFKEIIAENISVDSLMSFLTSSGYETEALLSNVGEIIPQLVSGKTCPECGKALCYSDMPQYSYVCSGCQLYSNNKEEK